MAETHTPQLSIADKRVPEATIQDTTTLLDPLIKQWKQDVAVAGHDIPPYRLDSWKNNPEDPNVFSLRLSFHTDDATQRLTVLLLAGRPKPGLDHIKHSDFLRFEYNTDGALASITEPVQRVGVTDHRAQPLITFVPATEPRLLIGQRMLRALHTSMTPDHPAHKQVA
jgi:hypothetical protein